VIEHKIPATYRPFSSSVVQTSADPHGTQSLFARSIISQPAKTNQPSSAMSEYMYDGEPSPPPFFEDSTPEFDLCDSCENGTAAAWLCVQCGELSFCDSCWGDQLAHRRARARQTQSASRKPALLLGPHEKMTHSVYYRMTNIFNGYQKEWYNSPDTHVWASGAKWFGIGEGNDGYCFVSTRRLTDIIDKGATPECPEQFPSFVSFVGETGKHPASSCCFVASGSVGIPGGVVCLLTVFALIV
jgi:hypothetical protein